MGRKICSFVLLFLVFVEFICSFSLLEPINVYANNYLRHRSLSASSRLYALCACGLASAHALAHSLDQVFKQGNNREHATHDLTCIIESNALSERRCMMRQHASIEAYMPRPVRRRDDTPDDDVPPGGIGNVQFSAHCSNGCGRSGRANYIWLYCKQLLVIEQTEKERHAHTHTHSQLKSFLVECATSCTCVMHMCTHAISYNQLTRFNLLITVYKLARCHVRVNWNTTRH